MTPDILPAISHQALVHQPQDPESSERWDAERTAIRLKNDTNLLSKIWGSEPPEFGSKRATPALENQSLAPKEVEVPVFASWWLERLEDNVRIPVCVSAAVLEAPCRCSMVQTGGHHGD
jgi:hypothetical protein